MRIGSSRQDPAIREGVVRLLKSAGPLGMTIPELASSLGIHYDKVNTAVRRHKQIKKIGGAGVRHSPRRYAYVEGV